MTEDIVKSYLACLLRFPAETNDACLERFYADYDYSLDYGRWSELAALIEEHAHNGIALTEKMLSELSNYRIDLSGLDPAAAKLYHQRIIEQEQRKAAKSAGQRLLAIASGNSEESIDQVLSDVNVVDEQKQTAMDLPTHSAVGMKMYRERAEELSSGKPRMAFPWDVINRSVPFVYPDDLILLSGMSKIGKSSAAHQLALYNASKLNVLYFHNEDNTMKVFLRRIAQYQLAHDPDPLRSGGPLNNDTIEYRKLLDANVKSPEFMARIERENAFILQKIGNRLRYVYCPGWTAEQIVMEWRKQKRQHQIDLVVIDYLNKIEFYAKARTLGTMAAAHEYSVELFKREAGRKGAMTPCVLVQQENEDGTVRDTRSSYIKSQLHISLVRDVDDSGMQVTGQIKILRANDGMTGSFPARFYPPYMCWIA